ncbi:MAG: alpha/beta hydrolase [Oscillospiraceae bacterium]|nr:alpha/beta hydrolase [Oscillospiraceae bacterium]
MRWIEDTHFAEHMQAEAEPYLAPRRETGFDERLPGEPIYFEHYRADAPKGVIVISHGFTESIRKFPECIYYMLQAGYEVWGLDHRGHGLSFRPGGGSGLVVHADRFEDYVLDLVHLTETRVRPAAGDLPLYLFCHSMGGCVGAWLLEDHPGLFKKAVLSSPMLGLSFGKIPTPVAWAIAGLKALGPKGSEPMSPVERFPEETFEASASNSEARFDWYYARKLADPKLQTCAASAGWGREAIAATWHVTAPGRVARIQAPILLFQAENDTFVVNAAQDKFAARAKDCTLVKLPGKRHELFFSESSDLRAYWERIFAFYES